jgi:hypothetical protein
MRKALYPEHRFKQVHTLSFDLTGKGDTRRHSHTLCPNLPLLH